MRSIWSKYYSETHGLIFILDSADNDRFNEVKQLIDDLIHHKDLENVPVLICCNKQDKSDALSIDKIINELQLSELLIHQNTPYRIHGTSCLTGYIIIFNRNGIKECIEWLIEQSAHTRRAINFNT